jgi:sterol desaturase/sphingolipid hydroxylase (fatty acid hydroxylase superfamily)
MIHQDTIVVTSVLLGLGVIEILSGSYFNSKRRKDDYLIDIVSVAQLAILIKPSIVFLSAWFVGLIFPDAHNCLAGLPLWLGVLIIFVPDEFLHYWYHRKGHEWAWLWDVHKTHHTSPDMNIGVSYRENWLWFVLMPNLWYAATMAFLGLGKAYIISTMLIGVVDVITHTNIKWDKFLYQYTYLKPFTWVLERIITLPSTHHAHHGIDEHSAPMGNYATTLILWDVIFGTSHFPHRYPTKYGIENDPKDRWYNQLWNISFSQHVLLAWQKLGRRK